MFPIFAIRPACWSQLLALLVGVIFSSDVSADEAGPDVARPYFGIRVVDEGTGRGVPLVELATVNQIRYVTDSAGWIAFHEPGLAHHDIFFTLESDGYEFPADGFGYRGKKLTVTPGSSVVLEIHRTNLAERLYRVTGAGIYRDSLLLGLDAPIQHPLLNAGVLGSDSVMNAVFQGKLYWFWGDTLLPSYPLGLFHTPGATSQLPSAGGLDPRHGVNLEYFTGEDGIAANTAKMPGSGPTWINGLTVLSDNDGQERMFAGYAKIEPPLTAYKRGIAEWNPTTNRFKQRREFAADVPLFPDGHSLRVTTDGTDYVYFAQPFPIVRVPATPDAFLDLGQYETLTCLASGSTADSPVVDRRDDGSLHYAWKKGVPAMNWQLVQTLIDRDLVKPDELRFQLFDSQTGEPINAHGGSITWNAYRQKYVMIVLEVLGSSPLGEIWYAESDALFDGWKTATKIVSHDNYSFYNPKQHEVFAQEGGRIIYFEGTYTHTFTTNPDQTPRYDYNQIMYRLDLSNPQLHAGNSSQAQ